MREARMRNWPVLVSALAVMTLAACGQAPGDGKDTGTQPTMNQDDANATVDKHIQDTLAQLPGATLKERLRLEDDPCSDPEDHGPEGRVSAQRDYEVIGVDPVKIPQYFETINAWWNNNNFHVLDNQRKHEYLWVENNQDHSRLALQASEGHLFLLASSSCVWPGGIPEPSS